MMTAKEKIFGEVEEAELWKAFLHGKQSALADLFLAQYDRLYRYGFRLYGDQELVKDCIQELFLKLWQKQRSLHEIREVGPYLCQALRRVIIDSLRQGSRHSRILDFVAQNQLEVSFSREEFLISQQIDEEQRHRLTKALNRLTKRQREAIHLRYLGIIKKRYRNRHGSSVADSLGLETIQYSLKRFANLQLKTFSHFGKPFPDQTAQPSDSPQRNRTLPVD